MSHLDCSPRHGLHTDPVKWLSDPGTVAAWAKQYDLQRLLEEGKGFARISNLLPEFVAEHALGAFRKLPARAWERTGAADRDDSGYGDSIPHHFSLFEVEDHQDLLDVSRALWQLLPEAVPNFTAARYGPSDHIAPHDDLVKEDYAWKEVAQLSSKYEASSSSSSRQTAGAERFGLTPWKGRRSFNRQVAAVYYLNRDWPTDCGGMLVDMQTGEAYPPEFNSLVIFTVPRMHMVTAIESVKLQRFSIFGWWLKPAEDHAVEGGDTPALPVSRQVSRGAAVKKRPSAQVDGRSLQTAVPSALARPARADVAGAIMKRPAAGGVSASALGNSRKRRSTAL